MQIEEVVKSEIEIFKVFVAIVLLLAGGLYGLLLQLHKVPVYDVLYTELKALFAGGIILCLIFIIASVKRYFVISKLLKRLKQNKE